jgi:hypothetical protein
MAEARVTCAPYPDLLTALRSQLRHPHYGIGAEEVNYGSQVENGHVLQLAAGFPFETTIAITRLILAGVYDRHPGLKLLLAHSGGALTQLSSRLASCVEHDPIVSKRLKHDPRFCAPSPLRIDFSPQPSTRTDLPLA